MFYPFRVNDLLGLLPGALGRAGMFCPFGAFAFG